MASEFARRSPPRVQPQTPTKNAGKNPVTPSEPRAHNSRYERSVTQKGRPLRPPTAQHGQLPQKRIGLRIACVTRMTDQAGLHQHTVTPSHRRDHHGVHHHGSGRLSGHHRHPWTIVNRAERTPASACSLVVSKRGVSHPATAAGHGWLRSRLVTSTRHAAATVAARSAAGHLGAAVGDHREPYGTPTIHTVICPRKLRQTTTVRGENRHDDRDANEG